MNDKLKLNILYYLLLILLITDIILFIYFVYNLNTQINEKFVNIYYRFVYLISSIGIIITGILNIKFGITNLINNPRLQANTKIIDTEGMIYNDLNLLRFHINEDPNEWLKKYDLIKEEFAYLLKSFSLSSTLYSTSPNKKSLDSEDSYRDRMFRTNSMQKAWPAIKIMLANKEFVKEMDTLYNRYHKGKL